MFINGVSETMTDISMVISVLYFLFDPWLQGRQGCSQGMGGGGGLKGLGHPSWLWGGPCEVPKFNISIPSPLWAGPDYAS